MPPDHSTSTPLPLSDVERWLPMPDWPGYEVSDWGRVRSYWMPGGVRTESRKSGIRSKSRLLRCSLGKRGYLVVTIARDGQRHKARYVHSLVLEAFVGPCPPGMEACHGPDPTQTNNRLDNLRWDTRSKNLIDSVTLNARVNMKLTAEDIPVIRERLAREDCVATIAHDYRVSKTTIFDVKSGKCWSHVIQAT